MIQSNCRHFRPPPNALDQPWICAQLIDVTTVVAPHNPDDPGRIRLACFADGRAVGATCSAFAPWTAEEIAAEKAAFERVFASIKKKVCPTCGQPSIRRGNYTICERCDKVIAHHTPKSSIDRWCGPE